jgi:hypothetical protein
MLVPAVLLRRGGWGGGVSPLVIVVELMFLAATAAGDGDGDGDGRRTVASELRLAERILLAGETGPVR